MLKKSRYLKSPEILQKAFKSPFKAVRSLGHVAEESRNAAKSLLNAAELPK